MYLSFSDSCMTRAEGDKQKADYLFNMSWFSYYWTIVEYNRYQDMVRASIKEQQNLNK